MEGTVTLQGIQYRVGGKLLLKTPLASLLLPGDQIHYTLSAEDQALFTDLKSVKRTSQTTLAIVRGLSRRQIYLFCPLKGILYNPAIPIHEDSPITVGDRFLISIPANAEKPPQLLNQFPSVYNRLGDLEALEHTYSSYNLSPLKLKGPVATPCYTMEEQAHLDLPTFSIDPEGSLDADDAITLLSEHRLLVHIVDINALLTDPGTEEAAAKKAFTLYLPNKTSHILPPEYATDLFSLKVGQVRKVITIDVRFEPGTANVKSYDIYKDTIVNKRAYTYKEAEEAITNRVGDFAYVHTFLDSRRDLQIPQIKLTVDPTTGKLMFYRSEVNTDVAHKFIERSMILANTIVSKHLTEHAQTHDMMSQIPQRFHSRAHSKTLTEMPISLSPVVQSFLAIKEYATATYSATETGHFGLSLPSYTHFTSPIRRYFDVILHRLLAGHVYDPAMLSTLLDHINLQERTVEGLQKLYTKWVLCDWMSPGTTFNATLTGVKKAGVYVLIEEIMLDGFIHVSQLGGKRWILGEGDVLASDGISLRIGDSLKVQVLSINKILQTIEFTAVF